jgi:hypothetical protein
MRVRSDPENKRREGEIESDSRIIVENGSRKPTYPLSHSYLFSDSSLTSDM